MKSSLKLLTAVGAIVFLSSFTGLNSDEFVGTYGVSASDLSSIRLTIHPDRTFYYQDFSVTDNKIVVSGRWTLQGERVLLTSDDPNVNFHNVWSFTENGQVAKSRKGLCFYRLCKIDEE